VSVAEGAVIVVVAVAVAAAAVDNGLEYSPDEIVVSNGAKQAIWQVGCSRNSLILCG
jgi:aspartate/methionine/tyrosine aminotransferase